MLYVADRENNRIQIYDHDGRFTAVWMHLGAPFAAHPAFTAETPQDPRVYAEKRV
ncbi:MAG: hypothetical protein H0T92_23565 [Pyrinomonadaceae bacterium]|nr:hypothetical protein [Pyrinomonadaceae bacterium]